MKELLSPDRAVILLVVFYGIGIAGFLTDARLAFAQLTPLNLLLTLLVLLFFQKKNEAAFWIFFIVTYLLTWGIEFAGVQTGAVFGTYTYGESLGPKVGDTPLIIGINWFILIYAVGVWLQPLPGRTIVKSALGAVLVTGMDALIEPVAMKSDFWSWENDIIPTENYLGWWATSFFLFLIFNYLNFTKKNPLTTAVLIIQLLFFLILNLLL